VVQERDRLADGVQAHAHKFSGVLLAHPQPRQRRQQRHRRLGDEQDDNFAAFLQFDRVPEGENVGVADL
jgi:hypothetical protein